MNRLAAYRQDSTSGERINSVDTSGFIVPAGLIGRKDGSIQSRGGSSNSQSADTLPVQASCGIPATAAAYSMNITVVPEGMLSYLTTRPTGSGQPLVSTLNSFDGSVVANAAIEPAGTGGAVSVFVTNQTNVVLDINGYFAP